MLRVEIQDSENALTLKLEGRFTGDDAQSTRTLAARCGNGTKLVVDLTEITFIDPVGEDVLLFLGRFGAEFVAQTSYTLDVCERLRLRLARDGGSNESASHTKPGGRSPHSRSRENDQG